MALEPDNKTMKSDAQVSKSGLDPSDHCKQPSFIWNKRRKVPPPPSHPSPQDPPVSTTAGTKDELHKTTAHMHKQKKIEPVLTNEENAEQVKKRQKQIQGNLKKIDQCSPLLGSSRIQGRVASHFEEWGVSVTQSKEVVEPQGENIRPGDKRIIIKTITDGSNASQPNKAAKQDGKQIAASTSSPAGGPPPPPTEASSNGEDDDINMLFGLDDIDYTDTSTGALDYSSAMPDGSETVIAILDSGISASHNAFSGGKILPGSRSFVSQDEMDYSDHLGHGTQCAGLACGNDPAVLFDFTEPMVFRGQAVNAKLLVCKVVPDGSNEADIDAVCRAIEYIVAYNQVNPAQGERVNVISLSFGTSAFSRQLSGMIELAVCNDIIVVCAASNDGRTSEQPITYPARLGHVICIGSCNEHGKPSSFSPVGREMDVLAPGENLWAPTINTVNASVLYSSVTGTSFAAPIVAGVVCQLLEDLRKLCEHFNRQQLFCQLHNVWVVRELLKHMAVVSGRHDEEKGFGMLKPLEYFHRTSKERMRIVKRILGVK